MSTLVWLPALAALLVILAALAWVSVIAARDTLAAAEQWDCGDDADTFTSDPADTHYYDEPDVWSWWDHDSGTDHDRLPYDTEDDYT